MSTVAEPPCCSGKAAYTHRPPTRLSAHLKDQSKSTEPPTSKEAICLLEISPKVSNAYPPNLTPVATARGQAALHCLSSTPRKNSHSSPSLLTYQAPARTTRLLERQHTLRLISVSARTTCVPAGHQQQQKRKHQATQRHSPNATAPQQVRNPKVHATRTSHQKPFVAPPNHAIIVYTCAKLP